MTAPAPPSTNNCAVCGVECSKLCAACRLTVYCTADHQRQHWPQHKSFCQSNRPLNPADPVRPTAQAAVDSLTPGVLANGWRRGLSEEKAAEWLVDCYRMRLDDDYVWGGGNTHGLYNPANGKLQVMVDFLHFILLARRNGVITGTDSSSAQWWQHLATQAGLQLGYAFEKSDAQDKYGGENVFSVATGGRSLRYTAERVYGHGMSAMEEPTELYERTENEVNAALRGGFGGPAARAAFWAEIGGFDVWQAAYRALRVSRR